MYVSTVDSGNLAAHLLTLRVGLLAVPDEPILPRRVFAGIGDTLEVLRQLQAGDATTAQRELRRELDSAIAAGVTTLSDARRRLDRLEALAGVSASDRAAPAAPASTGAQQDWAQVLLDQCRAVRDEVALLAPWTSLVAPPSGLEDLLPHAQVPTLREIAALEDRALPLIAQELTADRDDAARAWLLALGDAITAGSSLAQQHIAGIDDLARQASEFATPDFDFLYDRSRRLLAIGYNVSSHTPKVDRA